MTYRTPPQSAPTVLGSPDGVAEMLTYEHSMRVAKENIRGTPLTGTHLAIDPTVRS
jgi:hypothetical protein